MKASTGTDLVIVAAFVTVIVLGALFCIRNVLRSGSFSVTFLAVKWTVAPPAPPVVPLPPAAAAAALEAVPDRQGVA